MKGTIRERRETEWGKIREEDKPWETPNFGKQTKGCRRRGGWEDGLTGWRAWWDDGGHMMRWVLCVILYVGKLNLNKISKKQ